MYDEPSSNFQFYSQKSIHVKWFMMVKLQQRRKQEGTKIPGLRQMVYDGKVTTTETRRNKIPCFLLGLPLFATLLAQSNFGTLLSKNDSSALNIRVPTTTSHATIEQSSIYHFPVQPLYDVQSKIEDRIGSVVLNDPVQNPFTHCAATVQYELHIVNRTINESTTKTAWILKSMMLQSRDDTIAKDETTNEKGPLVNVPVVVPKPYGGDEIYVEWKSNTDMGVANITDQHDGTYLLEFIRPPAYQYNMTNNLRIISIGAEGDSPTINFNNDNNATAISDESFGQLIIYFHYTCGVAGYYALEKKNFTGLGDIRQSLMHFHIPKPTIQEFLPPNLDGAIDFSTYDVLIPFGDSLMREFFQQTFVPDSCELHYGFAGCPHALSNHSDAQFWINWFATNKTNVIEQAVKNNQTIALITGSAIWDFFCGALRPDMIEHLGAIREFIAFVRAKYPNVDIIWKSPSAVHLHRRDVRRPINPLHGNVGTRNLNIAQKQLMKELDVPFLDLYDAYYLSAAWTFPQDTMHFRGSTLPTVMVSYFWPGLVERFDSCNLTLVSKFVRN